MKKIYIQFVYGEPIISTEPLLGDTVKTTEVSSGVFAGIESGDLSLDKDLKIIQSPHKKNLEKYEKEKQEKRSQVKQIKEKLAKGSASFEEIQIALSKLL